MLRKKINVDSAVTLYLQTMLDPANIKRKKWQYNKYISLFVIVYVTYLTELIAPKSITRIYLLWFSQFKKN